MLPTTTPAPVSPIPEPHLEQFLAANQDAITDQTVSQLVTLLVHSPPMQPILTNLVLGLRNGHFIAAVIPLIRLLAAVADVLIGLGLDYVAHGATWRKRLRRAASAVGHTIHDYRRRLLQMPNGFQVKVTVPWFAVKSRTGRRKRGPKKPTSARHGRHLSLERFGFFNQVCPLLAFKALRLGVLCPSLEIASTVLKDEGIVLSQNKIRSLFAPFDDLTEEERAQLSCRQAETLAGRRVCILMDGGRMRERVAREGRIPKDHKRRPFDTPWRAPLLFTIFTINAEGKMEEDFPVLADGVVGDWKRAMALLEAHLRQLHVDQAQELILMGDGDENIWRNLPPLAARLTKNQVPIVEILDYYHAAEYLHDLFQRIDTSPLVDREALLKQAKEMLFKGQIQSLYDLLVDRGAPGSKRELKNKLTSYFLGNQARLCYEPLKNRYPIGSGQVESAIRSVINLRIKSPSTYWLEKKAETMIFLRSKLLYGRWEVLKTNWLARQANLFVEDIALDNAA